MKKTLLQAISAGLCLTAIVFGISACGGTSAGSSLTESGTPAEVGSTAVETAAPASEAAEVQSETPAPQEAAAEAEPEAPAAEPDTDKIIISEVMAKNHAFLAADDGKFYDWIELENISDTDVDLSGWIMKNGDRTWTVPEATVIPAGGFTVIRADKDSADSQIASFSVKDESVIELYDASGIQGDVFACIESEKDCSMIRDGDEITVTDEPTPGFENTENGYRAYQESRETPADLIISEVMVENRTCRASDGNYYDWVEILNNSGAAVDLADYYLSDDEGDLYAWQMPDRTLGAGERVIIYCSGDPDLTGTYAIHADFSLNAEYETLYLSSASGLADYAVLKDIPLEGSFGRAEGQNGWYYFETPTPGSKNTSEAYSAVTAKPSADCAGGTYNDIDSLTVTLIGDGDIYYTTDGSAPVVGGQLYTGPLTLTETTVVRAVSVREGCAASRILTENYIINENFTLPVLCITADEPRSLMSAYWDGYKLSEYSGNFALYEDGSVLQTDCGIEMAGNQSLASSQYEKRSFDILFKGVFGADDVEYDLFGETSKYASLNVRAGQDYLQAVFRDELMQDLCLEASDDVVTQHSKYCILYLNGQYWGIYCIKEDLTRSFAAETLGVDKSEVVMDKAPLGRNDRAKQEIIQYCLDHDMSVDENYQEFCRNVNIDSMIDWFLIECWCGNSDFNNNIRYMKAEGGQWQLVFFDLDYAFYAEAWNSGFSLCLDRSPLRDAYLRLFKNADFVDALLTRYAELLTGTLSVEHVQERIDYYVALLSPDIGRDRIRWYTSTDTWEKRVDLLRSRINEDHVLDTIDQLCTLVNATGEQKQQYFGDIINSINNN